MCEMTDGSGDTFVTLWLRLQAPTQGKPDRVSWASYLTSLPLLLQAGWGGVRHEEETCYLLGTPSDHRATLQVSHEPHDGDERATSAYTSPGGLQRPEVIFPFLFVCFWR